ncbi:MAG: hypothetical protein QNJ88_09230 [Acidimicrobiia bacterium]|nr:hypothetical protein [Acidimicrobiia bacterium]
MRRKLAVVLAVFALAIATFALPASAGGGQAGEFELDLALYECPNHNAPEELLVWVGTAKFGKKTVGMAYFEKGFEYVGDTGFIYFEELWTFFKLPRFMWHEDVMKWAACDPHRVLMEGLDAGAATPNGMAFAAGPITYGKHHLDKYVGGEIFWYGSYLNEEGTEFAGDLWLMRPDMK